MTLRSGSWKRWFLEQPHLRFDGLYVSRNTYIKTGVAELSPRKQVCTAALLITHAHARVPSPPPASHRLPQVACCSTPLLAQWACPFTNFLLLTMLTVSAVLTCNQTLVGAGACSGVLPVLQVLSGRDFAVPHEPTGAGRGLGRLERGRVR